MKTIFGCIPDIYEVHTRIKVVCSQHCPINVEQITAMCSFCWFSVLFVNQSDLEEMLSDWSEDKSVGDIILKYVSTNKSLFKCTCWIFVTFHIHVCMDLIHCIKEVITCGCFCCCHYTPRPVWKVHLYFTQDSIYTDFWRWSKPLIRHCITVSTQNNQKSTLAVSDLFSCLCPQSEKLVKAYPPFVNFFEMSKETIVRCEKLKPRFHAFLKVWLFAICNCRNEFGCFMEHKHITTALEDILIIRHYIGIILYTCYII